MSTATRNPFLESLLIAHPFICNKFDSGIRAVSKVKQFYDQQAFAGHNIAALVWRGKIQKPTFPALSASACSRVFTASMAAVPSSNSSWHLLSSTLRRLTFLVVSSPSSGSNSRQLAIQVFAERGVDLAECWLGERLIKHLSSDCISQATCMYHL